VIRQYLSLSGKTAPLAFVLIAPLILLSQHAYVAAALIRADRFVALDPWFWFFPVAHLSKSAVANDMLIITGSFVMCLLAAVVLTGLAFRRANWAGRGHGLALLAMVPTVQLVAIVLLALLPPRSSKAATETDRVLPPADGGNRRHVVVGVLAGMTIIVAAVVVSATTFGAYGWGLFVLTPFLSGFVTAWLANWRQDMSMWETSSLVALAGTLACIALLMLALEGLACIILILPLATGFALLGGAFGRMFARMMHDPTGPFVSIAALPLLFVMEAALPPQQAINAAEHIDIAASPQATWAALTANRPITAPPGLFGRAGLAYAVGSHLSGDGVGAERIGYFSTGKAQERVTLWRPERELALRVLSQPPAMEEMSPYRRVHAPHVEGYFLTETTRFALRPGPNGGTRLTIAATHQLRLDPIPYWAPIARWAISANMQRVLGDIRRVAEATE
jgi:hypothetical protein